MTELDDIIIIYRVIKKSLCTWRLIVL